MSALELTLTFLLAGVLAVSLFRLVHLPTPLAFLTVGALIGPLALGLVPDGEATRQLGDVGVVFLMFSIGLEFNLARVKTLGLPVLGLGVGQVTLTILATLVLGSLVALVFPGAPGLSWQGWVALGAALSMSSTAIVVRLLAERLELDAAHGRLVVGVLLFQDLAVVVILVLLPALTGSRQALLGTVLLVVGKIALLFLVLLVFGQRIARAWLNLVARRRSAELFMLNLLLVTLGLAWLFERAGLSLALGSFVAGMLISETDIGCRSKRTSSRFGTSCSDCFSSPSACSSTPVSCSSIGAWCWRYWCCPRWASSP